MRILVDLGHPAHVHQFKNAIKILEDKGHDILVTARNKEVSFRLLERYNINYIEVGSYKGGILSKALEMLNIDKKLYTLARDFNPDILVGGVGNVYVAHVSYLLRKPSIMFNDTENAILQNLLSFPFLSVICTPSCYKKYVGRKQIRYNGYHELAYLHPNYFSPNPEVLKEIGLGECDPVIILRFVSWQASHDVGHKGLTMDAKRRAIHEFEKYGRVFITSEKPLPQEFDKYRISVAPEKMHDLLYYATLLYGESATMASECAVLGTHAIFCDFAGRGYTDEEEKDYGLVFNFKLDEFSQEKSIDKAVKLLQDSDLRQKGREKRERLLREKIDVTEFMVCLIETYPESINTTCCVE